MIMMGGAVFSVRYDLSFVTMKAIDGFFIDIVRIADAKTISLIKVIL
ncbi:MAG: hypothetical protein WCJ49_02245 [Deltaproteobacteria bacterium]